MTIEGKRSLPKQENINENPDDNQEVKNNSNIESSDDKQELGNNILDIVKQLRIYDTKTYERASLRGEYNVDISKVNTYDKHYTERAKNESTKIDIGDFMDIYGNKVITEDRKEVKKEKKKFEQTKKVNNDELKKEGGEKKVERENIKHKIAGIFEKMLPFLVEENNLFGPETTSISTSDYDDYFGAKIDNILEFSHGDGAYSHLGLAADLTIGGKDTINRKIESIKNSLDKGNTVKYFKSDRMHIKGQYKNIPKVVITGSTNTVIELMVLQKESTESGDVRINEHKFQFQALEEVLMQLEYFIKNIHNQAIKEKYEVSMNKIRNILEDKIKNIGIDKYKEIRGTYDRGYYALKEVLEEHFDIDKYIYKHTQDG